MRQFTRIVAYAVVLSTALAVSQAESKNYEKGKLIDIKPDSRVYGSTVGVIGSTQTYIASIVQVQVGDVFYVGDYTRRVPKDFIVGDDVDVRIIDTHMFLKKKNADEWKIRIIQRRRAGSQPSATTPPS